MNYLVGLTGGIGSGKSTVAQLFAALGARIVDTDLISHQLTQANGAAIPALLQAFGTTFIDAQGALDRARMRELVFTDRAAKERLEAILHPLILSQTREQATSPTDAPYTLIIVPLLFESGRYRDLAASGDRRRLSGTAADRPHHSSQWPKRIRRARHHGATI